jgi:hypothetical protein
MKNFHILLVGYANPIFSEIMMYVQDTCNYHISFIARSKDDVNSLMKSGISQDKIHCLTECISKRPVGLDVDYLNSLVQEGVPTIHNMIMSDHIVSKLPYTEGLTYASNLAWGFHDMYKEIKPSVIIGCHDGIHSSIGCAVAKMVKAPWFALSFCPIPAGYVALRKGIVPDEMVCLRNTNDKEISKLALKLISAFEVNKLKPITYISAYSMSLAIKRFPKQLKEGINRFKKTYSGGLNKYLEYDFKFVLKQFIRKKINLLTTPNSCYIRDPQKKPYIFFGLHMQPETTIDVYAPYYSDQFNTIKMIARSIPITHNLLVKLHISDADNYSRKQWRILCRLPGVKLVAPNVSSRKFIEKSSLVITITGNMGLEGALLGKQVLMFGKKNYEHFPNVTRVVDITNLPNLIIQKLGEKRPTRESIIAAYKEYLKPYFKASKNNWKREFTTLQEKDGFVELFQSLKIFLSK